jgi:hypothetical protein
VPALDVDDDLAIVFLLGSGRVRLAGLTPTFGNTLESLAFRDARRLLGVLGLPSVPLARGAGRLTPRGGRVSTAASRFLAARLREEPGRYTLLALGPLGNVAAAFREEPDLARSLAGLVVMGGRSERGLREFNFSKDPEAAAFVMSLPVPKTLVPFDAAFPVAITAEDVLSLPAACALGPYRARLARFARRQDLLRRALGRGRPGRGRVSSVGRRRRRGSSRPSSFSAPGEEPSCASTERPDVSRRPVRGSARGESARSGSMPRFREAFLSYLSRC